MRQIFDVGDIVKYGTLKGLVIESQPILALGKKERKLHVEEYRCKVKFFSSEDSPPRWIRAKHLVHLSKISE